jgi:D-glycero-D-manno-heptose 1,7-bisphosphate phosphatase
VARPSARPGLILLDRDGVLNRMVVHPEHGTVDSPMNASEVSPIPAAVQAAARLTAAGWTLAICTNQPAAAKGKTTEANLRAAHQVVLDALAAAGARVAGSYLCLHRAEDGCTCRKPKPGMLKDAIAAHGWPGAEVWMVGDGVTDVEAGLAAGTRTAFVGGTKCDTCRVLRDRGLHTDFRGEGLAQFTDYLLSRGDA